MNFINRLNSIVEKIIRACIESSESINETYALNIRSWEPGRYTAFTSESFHPLIKLSEINNDNDLAFIIQFLVT